MRKLNVKSFITEYKHLTGRITPNIMWDCKSPIPRALHGGPWVLGWEVCVGLLGQERVAIFKTML